MATRYHVPRSTYRLQLNKQLPLSELWHLGVSSYLKDLGISHYYLSPILNATSGSTHGYDCTDWTKLNPEIVDFDFESFSKEASSKNLGIILDFVPNHSGVRVPHENPHWWDVLQHGRYSPRSHFFDIDWAGIANPHLAGKILVPVLGDLYGRVLTNGELKIDFAVSGKQRRMFHSSLLVLKYWDHTYPLSPGALALVLAAVSNRCTAHSPELANQALAIARELATLPTDDLRSRSDLFAKLTRLLDTIFPIHTHSESFYVMDTPVKIAPTPEMGERGPEFENPANQQLLGTLTEINGRRGSAGFEGLGGMSDEEFAKAVERVASGEVHVSVHDVLECQNYRLCHWRLAGTDINYRRFFEINELAALRAEDPTVFKDTHALLLDLVSRGLIHGLRVDHVDGLLEPNTYLVRLQSALREAVTSLAVRESGHTMNPPLYVIIEKILDPLDEVIREEWPIYGTTGYEFTNMLTGVLVRPEGKSKLLRAYNSFIGESGVIAPKSGDQGGMSAEPTPSGEGGGVWNVEKEFHKFEELVYECKRWVLERSFQAELSGLTRRAHAIAQRHTTARDFPTALLRAALTTLISAFPVYRSYIDCEIDHPEKEIMITFKDGEYFISAAKSAVERSPMNSALHSAIRWLLSVFLFTKRQMDDTGADFQVTDVGSGIGDLSPKEREDRAMFAMKFQQLSSAVQAKGFEDTALYRYFPLPSMNEVGGHPLRLFDVTVNTFHESNERVRSAFPHTLLTTSTHDTKRSEDVRARLNVLSEIPDQWESFLNSVRSISDPIKDRNVKLTSGGVISAAPDPTDEYLIYSTLVGVWPFDLGRAGGAGAAAAAVGQRDMAELNKEAEAEERKKEQDELVVHVKATHPHRVQVRPLQSEQDLSQITQRVSAYILKAAKESKRITSWTDQEKNYENSIPTFVSKLVLENSEFGKLCSGFVGEISRAGLYNSLAQVVLKCMSPGVPDIYAGTELWSFALVDPDNRRPVPFLHLKNCLVAMNAKLTPRDHATATETHFQRISALREMFYGFPEDGLIKMFFTRECLHLRRRAPALFRAGEYVPLQVSGPLADHIIAFARVLHSGPEEFYSASHPKPYVTKSGEIAEAIRDQSDAQEVAELVGGSGAAPLQGALEQGEGEPPVTSLAIVLVSRHFYTLGYRGVNVPDPSIWKGTNVAVKGPQFAAMLGSGHPCHDLFTHNAVHANPSGRENEFCVELDEAFRDIPFAVLTTGV